MSLLRTPIVRRLVAASFVSALGSAMSAVAIAFVAYQRSKSLVLTVVVLAASALPALLLSPVVGKLATRGDPRTVDVLGQSAKVAIAAGIATVATVSDLSYGLLLVFNLLNGTVSALTAPTWPEINRMVASKDRLAELTALFSGASAVAAIIGALVGGVVVATVGAVWAFAFNAVSYVPNIIAIRTIPGDPPTSRGGIHAVRAGLRVVGRTAALRRAFVLAAVLNLAAWPVLSALPALAREIDPRAHALGYLTGAFYAGAAIVSYAVARLRRRYPYGTVLFAGFLTAGLMLLAHAMLTYWRDPGLDAVVTAALTLVPIGLAVSLDSALLQALVQLGSPPGDEGPVLVVYATVTTIVAPLGGLLLGTAADLASLWWALAGAGLVLTALSLALRGRLAVFNTIGQEDAVAQVAPASHHWALVHLLGADFLRDAFTHLESRPETPAR